LYILGAREWQPSWLKGLTGDALMKAIDARLESVVPHFRGKFLHWDVNNEMPMEISSKAAWESPYGLTCSKGPGSLIRMQNSCK